MVKDDRYGLRGWGKIYIVLASLTSLIPLTIFLEDLLRYGAATLIADFLHNGSFQALIIYTLFALLLGSTYLIHAPRWDLVNYRRQMAAYWGFAARVPLAQPHPLPNVGALPVPFTIKLKPNWPKLVIALGVPLSLAIYMDTYEYRVHGDHITNILNPFVWILDIIPLLGIVLIMVLWLQSQQIEVTQEGLTVRHTFHDWLETNTGWRDKKHTIRWNEARLFAVRDGKLGAPAIHYELSGPYAVVKWRRIRRPRWWSLQRSAIPFAEYDAQMEALIALISGVTGLPLYDVR